MRLNETDDLIDICYDIVFKSVFTRNSPESRGALEDLLSAVTGQEIAVETVVANEPPAGSLLDRQIRFDINCRTADGELVDIEMSLNPSRHEPVRLEYYAGELFTSQSIQGMSYGSLKKAYQIAFLVNRNAFQDREYLHCFEYYDRERGVSLGGKTRIITVELSKLEETARKAAGEMTKAEMWAVYFRYITDKSKREKINTIIEQEEGIAMASRVLMTISRDEEEHARYMSRFKFEMDYNSGIIDAREEWMEKGIQAGRQEGIKAGRQEGIKAGRQEGIQAGRQEGIQVGERKNAVKIAKTLKELGDSVERIARVTGLSPDEIAGL
jgi:predicted transposase/invertase (TIGR01784 family)